MPVSTTTTGFDNLIVDPLAKINIFPSLTVGHYFDVKKWTITPFTLTSMYIVTKRPL